MIFCSLPEACRVASDAMARLLFWTVDADTFLNIDYVVG